MDRALGVSFMSESKSLVSARQRNQTQDKMLAQKCETIQLHMKTRCNKLLTDKIETEEFKASLDGTTISPGPLPAGLTREQKQKYRQLFRTASTASISLAELDRRLAERQRRNWLVGHTSNLKLNPRPGYRYLSHWDQQEEQTQRQEDEHEYESVIDNPSTHFPLSKRKQTVRGAWARAVSEDVRYRSTSQPQSYHSSVTSILSCPSSFASKAQPKFLCKSRHGPIEVNRSGHHTNANHILQEHIKSSPILHTIPQKVSCAFPESSLSTTSRHYIVTGIDSPAKSSGIFRKFDVESQVSYTQHTRSQGRHSYHSSRSPGRSRAHTK